MLIRHSVDRFVLIDSNPFDRIAAGHAPDHHVTVFNVVLADLVSMVDAGGILCTVLIEVCPVGGLHCKCVHAALLSCLAMLFATNGRGRYGMVICCPDGWRKTMCFDPLRCRTQPRTLASLTSCFGVIRRMPFRFAVQRLAPLPDERRVCNHSQHLRTAASSQQPETGASQCRRSWSPPSRLSKNRRHR